MKLIIFSITLLVSIFVYKCQKMTAIVVLHGRGESITNGNTYNFVKNLKKVLKNKSLNKKYKIVKIGLSDNSTEEMSWSQSRDMSFQLQKLCHYIKRDQTWKKLQNSNRIILVGFSQGALLLRGLLWDNCLDPFIGKMDKLITFGGPNNGVFGIPDCSLLKTSKLTEDICDRLVALNNALIGPSIMDVLMYSVLLRNTFSFTDYWNSPSIISTSRRLNTYLAKINNENNNHLRGKYLSKKLKNGLVLISFGKESVVLPTITTSFGYWDIRGINIMSYNETDLYKYDRIGLKALDQKKKISLYTIENRSHMSIPYDFVKNKFLDYLK